MSIVLLAFLAAGAYGIGSAPVHRAFGLTDIDDPSRGYSRCRSLSRVVLNMLKGFVVVEIGSLLGPTGALLALYAVAFGHNYPVWTTFGGGTGLGVILGATIALDPTMGIISLAAWTFSYYSFANRTAAALTSSVATPFSAPLLGLVYPVYSLLPVTVLVIWRYRKLLSDLLSSDPTEAKG